MNSKRANRPAQRVDIASKHISQLRSHLTRGDLEDQLVFDAVAIRLASAIEEISNLPTQDIELEFGKEWAAIWATRNAVAHAYVYVDKGLLKDTVAKDLEVFEMHLASLAANYN